MRSLLAADWVRFGRRRDLWFLLAAVPVLLAVMFVSDFNSATTPPEMHIFLDPPDPVMEAQLRAQALEEFRQGLVNVLPAFTFPASLIRVTGNFWPLALLAIYSVMALVGAEFEWGTVRTLHLTASRRRTVAARVAVIAAMIGAAVAAALVLGAVLPFLLSYDGRPVQDYAAPAPNLLSDIGVRLVLLLPFIAIPVLLAVLARSMVTAFLFTILFFVADLTLTEAPIWAGGPASWMPAVTVSGSILRLLGGPSAPLASVAPTEVSVAAMVGWTVLPVLAAIVTFQRLDLEQ
jgi:hypothetical protein